MPFIVNSVFSIGEISPDRVRQKLVLGSARPVFETRGMSFMLTDHLLQKNDVGIKRPQTVAQLVHHHASHEMGKTFVDVIGSNMKRVKHIAKNHTQEPTAEAKTHLKE